MGDSPFDDRDWIRGEVERLPRGTTRSTCTACGLTVGLPATITDIAV